VFLLDAEKECLTNPAGRGYSGTAQYSASGRKCEHWSKTPHHLGINLRDLNTDDAQNYCRRIPGLDWPQPSCLVSASSGVESTMRIEPCNIEYCGAESKTRASSLVAHFLVMNSWSSFYTTRFTSSLELAFFWTPSTLSRSLEPWLSSFCTRHAIFLYQFVSLSPSITTSLSTPSLNPPFPRILRHCRLYYIPAPGRTSRTIIQHQIF